MKLGKIHKWILFVLILASGIFASCEKDHKLTVYLFYCDISEFTSDMLIEDPELQVVYQNLRIDLITDLTKLKLNDKWDTWAVNDKFSVEDVKAEAEYDKHLPALKELESKYKKRIEEIGLQSTSSFYIKVVYNLSRSVPADYSQSVYLREYSFELRYDR